MGEKLVISGEQNAFSTRVRGAGTVVHNPTERSHTFLGVSDTMVG